MSIDPSELILEPSKPSEGSSDAPKKPHANAGRSFNDGKRSPAEMGVEIPPNWKPTMAEPIPVVRCVHIKKDGERCKKWSIRGHTKCYAHTGWGNLPNVQEYADKVVEAARIRLIGNTDAAVDTLEQLMDGSTDSVRLKSATEILDRAGVRGGFEILHAEEGEKEDAAAKIRRQLETLRRNTAPPGAVESDEDIVDAVVIDDHDQLELFE